MADADEHSGCPAGYRSEEGKRKFTLLVGILGVGSFLGQFLLPFAVFLCMMPVFMTFGMEPQVQLEHMAWWQGEMWFCEENLESDQEPALKSWKLFEKKADTVSRASLPGAYGWLLPDGERLWIISNNHWVAAYQDGELEELPDAGGLGEMTHPFLYEGQPAVIDRLPNGVTLRVLEGGKWRKVTQIDILEHRMPEKKSETRDDAEMPLEDILQVVNAKGKIHVFLNQAGTIFHREGIPEGDSQDPNQWSAVATDVTTWEVTETNGRPVLVTARMDFGGASVEMQGLEDGAWKSTGRVRAGLPMNVLAFDSGRRREIVVGVEGFPGSFEFLLIRHGEVVKRKTVGRFNPFGGLMTTWIFFPHGLMALIPLLLAIVLAALMRKYRVCQYDSHQRQIPYASLTRRAFAQIVDSLLLGLPTIVGFFMIFRSGWRMFSPAHILIGMALVSGGMFWGLLGLVILSVIEGKRGITPGKWLLGIRVLGTDMKPCGVGRALVRNILKLVDGMCYFLVGILLVSLTKNWQRLGDMAAQTVVLRRTGEMTTTTRQPGSTEDASASSS
ncbi:MAG: RDD family protein [Candidatus Brocadiia bacterium]